MASMPGTVSLIYSAALPNMAERVSMQGVSFVAEPWPHLARLVVRRGLDGLRGAGDERPRLLQEALQLCEGEPAHARAARESAPLVPAHTAPFTSMVAACQPAACLSWLTLSEAVRKQSCALANHGQKEEFSRCDCRQRGAKRWFLYEKPGKWLPSKAVHAQPGSARLYRRTRLSGGASSAAQCSAQVTRPGRASLMTAHRCRSPLHSSQSVSSVLVYSPASSIAPARPAAEPEPPHVCL